MKIKLETEINAAAEKVWDLLGPRFHEPHVWASVVDSAKPVGQGKNGAPCGGRVCETPAMGTLEEKITHYDGNKHEIAFSIKGRNMPFFVKGMQNKWKVKKLGENKSLATNELDVNLMFPFNILMGFMMKMQMKGFLKLAHEEVKLMAETGKIHQRKVEALNKLNQATA